MHPDKPRLKPASKEELPLRVQLWPESLEEYRASLPNVHSLLAAANNLAVGTPNADFPLEKDWTPELEKEWSRRLERDLSEEVEEKRLKTAEEVDGATR